MHQGPNRHSTGRQLAFSAPHDALEPQSVFPAIAWRHRLGGVADSLVRTPALKLN